MRHKKKFNHLGRTVAHRKAMLSNMATSLIVHKRIKTTLAKAKALQVYVEPLITRSKEDTTHSRRMVFRKLQDKDAVSQLFREVATKIMDRKGGYTRILKIGNRLGDNAEMCIIELVDYNENMATKTAKPTKTKRRRSKKKTADTAKVEAPATAEKPVEEVKADETKAKAPKSVKPKTEAAKDAPKEEKKEDK